jgi:hypothetical protein
VSYLGFEFKGEVSGGGAHPELLWMEVARRDDGELLVSSVRRARVAVQKAKGGAFQTTFASTAA